MHWIVPFASSLSEPCQQALADMGASALPRLRRVLAQCREVSRLPGDEYALSMPHERVLAQTMGWPAPEDGLLPWSAWWAAQDGLTLDPLRPWGLLSPGHWLMGRDHLTLLDPDALTLDDVSSKALFDAVRPLFEEDGWTLLWGAPQRWYAAHDSLAGLPTASLDRVIGRNPDVWLNDHPQARVLRRLQSEVQMLLYQHPVNDARAAQGLPTVNSFWLSGCGHPPPQTALPSGVRLVNTLRTPLLADDMPAWRAAWQALDDTVMAEAEAAVQAGHPFLLTLCGERQALTLGPVGASSGLGGRLLRTLRHFTSSRSGADVVALLGSL